MADDSNFLVMCFGIVLISGGGIGFLVGWVLRDKQS